MAIIDVKVGDTTIPDSVFGSLAVETVVASEAPGSMVKSESEEVLYDLSPEEEFDFDRNQERRKRRQRRAAKAREKGKIKRILKVETWHPSLALGRFFKKKDNPPFRIYGKDRMHRRIDRNLYSNLDRKVVRERVARKEKRWQREFLGDLYAEQQADVYFEQLLCAELQEEERENELRMLGEIRAWEETAMAEKDEREYCERREQLSKELEYMAFEYVKKMSLAEVEAVDYTIFSMIWPEVDQLVATVENELRWFSEDSAYCEQLAKKLVKQMSMDEIMNALRGECHNRPLIFKAFKELISQKAAAFQESYFMTGA